MSALSGFCGVTNPLDSHRRCTKADCPCIHHRMPVAEPRLVHFMADDLLPACDSVGDSQGVITTPVVADVTCPDCRAMDIDAAPAGDPVAGLQDAVRALGKAMPDLVDAADDPDALGLAQLLLEVREARTTLYGLEQDLEGITAKAMLADEVDGAGVRVERYRARDRKEWDHSTWQRDVRAQALRKHGALKAAAVVTQDGEPLDVDLYQLLADVQAVHGAGAPKSTSLRKLGLDVADYCTTLPGTKHVRVTRLATEANPETETSKDGGTNE